MTRSIAMIAISVILCAMGRAADPHPNGAEAYHEAFKLLGQLSSRSAEVTGQGDTILLGVATDAALKEAEPALAALHRGAQAGHCDWAIDYKQGFQVKLPFLSQSRQLALTACLRARTELLGHNPAMAAQDFVDAMQLANDVGNDGIAVSQLVRQSTQTTIAKCITANAWKLPKEDAAALLAQIQAPKSREQLKTAFRRDKEATVAALPKLNEADLRLLAKSDVDVGALSELPDLVDDVARTYDRVIALLDTTPEEADREAKSMRQQYVDAKNPASVFVPSAGRALQSALDADKAIAKAREELAKR